MASPATSAAVPAPVQLCHDVPPPARSPLALLHWHEPPSTPADASPAVASPFPTPKEPICHIADPPLASIGILSDIQYCAKDNGMNYQRTEIRYYRHAIDAAERAMQDYVDSTAKVGGPPVQHVLHLGDLVDGVNKRLQTSHQALDDIMKRLPRPATARSDDERRADRTSTQQATDSAAEAEAAPSVAFPQLSMYHLIGNHEIANFPRRVWADRLGMGDLARRSIAQAEKRGPIDQVDLKLQEPMMFPAVEPASDQSDSSASASAPSSSSDASPFTDASPLYYDFTLADGRYRFVVLDAFDIALLGRDPSDPIVHQARGVLTAHNLGADDHTPHGDTYHTKRFVAYNGGIGQRQLQWLVRVLEDAREHHQYVILCSHVPFDPRATQDFLQVWNQHELLAIVERHPQVVACFHGHDHRGGHHTDERGVHHHVFEAILTAPDARSSHGRLDLYDDRMELRGVDLMTSYTMPIPDRAKEMYAQK